jgi:hypothetical protein
METNIMNKDFKDWFYFSDREPDIVPYGFGHYIKSTYGECYCERSFEILMKDGTIVDAYSYQYQDGYETGAICYYDMQSQYLDEEQFLMWKWHE